MPKLILDSAEYTFLSKTAPSYAAALETVDPKLTSEREKELWRKLASKFPPILGDIGEVECTFNRHELKEVRAVARTKTLEILGSIIPEYQKRQREKPEKANFYQEYIDKNAAKVAGIQSLIKKLEGAL
jgi:gamma-glutamyl:cysteine ligase YbdK (ATP-grasp superfamily)